MLHHAVWAAAVALALASVDPAAAQRIRAGVLNCDVSAGIGLIIGSQKQVSCVYQPELPGPQEAVNPLRDPRHIGDEEPCVPRVR